MKRYAVPMPSLTFLVVYALASVGAVWLLVQTLRVVCWWVVWRLLA